MFARARSRRACSFGPKKEKRLLAEHGLIRNKAGQALGISLVCALGSLMLSNAFAVGREGWVASGAICFTNFNVGGEVLMSFSNRFVIQVSGSLWQMQIVPEDKTVFDYSIVAFDGSNTYFYKNLETGVFLRTQKGENVGLNTGVGGIVKGPIPRFPSVHEAGPLWLALASGYYWPTIQKRSRIEPATTLNVGSWAAVEPWLTLPQTAEWSICTQEPFLPERVVYFADGVFRSQGKLEPDPVVQWAVPYRKGFTNAIYRVEQFETFDGLRLPKRAVLKTFWPKHDGTDASQLQVVNEYTIYVDNATKTNVTLEFPLRVPGLTLFVDYRFCNEPERIQRIQYLRKERFLTDAEVRNLPVFKAGLGQSVLTETPQSERARWIRIGTLGAMSIVGIIFVAQAVIAIRRKQTAKP